MSEPNEPNRSKLETLFGAANFKPVEDQQTDKDWVADQLDPVAGDRVICTLNGLQIEAFIALTILDLELEELQQMLTMRLQKHQISMIQNQPATWEEFHKRHENFSLYTGAEEAEETWETFIESQYQTLAFWRDVRARNHCWGDDLEVRHGFVVVTTGKKYNV